MHSQAAQTNSVRPIDRARRRIVGQSRLVEIPAGVAPCLRVAVVLVSEGLTELAIQEINAHGINRHWIKGHEDAGRPLAVEEIAESALSSAVSHSRSTVPKQAIIDIEDGLVSQRTAPMRSTSIEYVGPLVSEVTR